MGKPLGSVPGGQVLWPVKVPEPDSETGFALLRPVAARLSAVPAGRVPFDGGEDATGQRDDPCGRQWSIVVRPTRPLKIMLI
ncbi:MULTISPECIES: hypothetical protein [unclassified Pseudofrankia]|uniref:hypothetical protein n=1 Tax=unclassified Pseudofrankia TaxID=2994372 RepID=UPI001041CCAC|nr:MULTISPECIES: hypothetical protein [unclassified Pseudofrankia]MDT3446803.1 hypothetical protein [Pseudofrankia sp. BMG5.37]